MLPPIMPEGDYRLDIEYGKDKNISVLYGLFEVYIHLRGLKLIDLKMGR